MVDRASEGVEKTEQRRRREVKKRARKGRETRGKTDKG